jgi:hypothetical protein
MSDREWGMFYRLIAEYRNGRISRSLFVIDWRALQKKQGIAVPEWDYKKGPVSSNAENKRD